MSHSPRFFPEASARSEGFGWREHFAVFKSALTQVDSVLRISRAHWEIRAG
jgi:hypothetical protein